jgi:hypothetical protein
LPTRQVADGFGEIGVANRRILVMEWAAEGITHISIGVVVVLIAIAGYAGDSTAQLVYRALACVLLVLAALTAATGARTSIVWFKACPFVLTGAAALLIAATLL